MQAACDWLVGVDLTPRSLGALRFAAWLTQKSGGAHRVHPVHVADDPTIGLHNDLGAGPDLGPTRERAQAYIEESDVGSIVGPIDVVPGAPAPAMRAVVAERWLSGVIVGRAHNDAPLVGFALGRTVRRLLRRLDVPIAIVAPDFHPEDLGAGPIAVGVVPRSDCLNAVRFARKLATAIDRELVLLHVPPEISAIPPAAGELDLQSRAAQAVHGSAELTLRRWLGMHGLGATNMRIAHGAPGRTLVTAARDESACMLVCGTRRLSWFARSLTPSVAGEVAAMADLPTIVVPP